MADWKESTIFTNSIKLNYYRSGGEKPPMVMLHGITDNGLCWLRLAEELVNEYDIILVDARGHGKSAKPTDHNTFTDMAEDFTGLISNLRLSEAVVIGHSMGAQTAAIMATRHPGIAGKLILEDPPWHLSEGVQRDEIVHSKKSGILRDRAVSVSDLTMRKMIESPLWDKSEFPAWSESKHQVNPDIYSLVLEETIPFTEIVPAITVPSLLISGDPSLGAIITNDIAQEVQRLNPLFQVARISQAGHNIRRENFSGTLEAIQDFLKT